MNIADLSTFELFAKMAIKWCSA